MSTKIAVIGAGSWGTALSSLLSHRGNAVKLWARRAELAEQIGSQHENVSYLPGFPLSHTIDATADLEYALHNTEVCVWVVPSHGLRVLLTESKHLLKANMLHVCAIKGIENDSLKLMSEIYEEYLPTHPTETLAALGGPSFAKEVALGVPTAVCMGSQNIRVAQTAQKLFSTDRFRVYTTEDVIGVELGGALKNVIAIAAGAVLGLGFGHNSIAALVTRGLAEMTRLAVKRGAHPLTLSGLSGMGDLMLTCTGELSRNRSVGVALGQGEPLERILKNMHMVAEGIRTSKSAFELAQREGVEMPIFHEVYKVLYEHKSPVDAVQTLMTRTLRPERDF